MTPDEAAVIFDELRVVCDQDGAELWGWGLWGPVLLIDPVSGRVFGNEPEPFDVELDAGFVIANTALEWRGRRWATVVCPLPVDAEERLNLLVHESWHRVQPDLGFAGASPVVAHLDELAPRLDLRLELRALARALRGDHDAFADALAFRDRRRGRPAVDAVAEDELESNEGLAEYTGRKLAHTQPEEAVAARLDAVDARTPFVRSFAYLTGPAYGLLLDRYSPGWRARALQGEHLTTIAGEAALPAPPGSVPLSRYHADEIEGEERAQAELRREQKARWTSMLVDGPTITLPNVGMQTVFDPGSLVPLGDHGTAYPGAKVTAAWGVVSSTTAVLIASDWSTIRISAECRDDLTLAPGWHVGDDGVVGSD